MPDVRFEQKDISLRLYGDVHVAVTSDGETNVDMRGCKVVRIIPPGKVTLEQLAKRRIVSIIPDDLVGHLYFRTPELPRGIEDEVPIINFPIRARLRIKMPVDPD